MSGVRCVKISRTPAKSPVIALAILSIFALFAAIHFDVPSSPAAAAEPAQLPVQLSVAPREPVIDPAAQTQSFEVLVENPTSEDLEPGSVTLWLGSTPITDPANLETVPSTLASEFVASSEVAAIAPGEQRQVNVRVESGTKALSISRAAGVYSLTAKYTSGEFTRIITSTPVVWQGVNAAAVKTTFVVPIVLPTDIEGVPSAQQLSQVSGSLIERVTQAESRGATLAVDPRIVVAVRTLGDRAPNNSRTLLERIESTPNPHFLLQFADADPAAQSALGMQQLMQPLGFDYLQPNVEPAGPVDGVDPRVALTELMRLPAARLAAWPAAGSATTQTLSLVQSASISQLVLDSTNVQSSTPIAQFDGFTALVSDTSLTAVTSELLSADNEVKRRSAAAKLASGTALGAAQTSAGSVIALDRAVVADAPSLDALFDIVDVLSWVQPVAETALPSGAATFVSGASEQARLDALAEARDRSTGIDALSGLLTTPLFLGQYQQARLMQTFSATFASPSLNQTEVFDGIADRDNELLQGVRPVSTKSIQLVGVSSEIPVTLRNWLPFETSVQVRATPVTAVILVTDRSYETTIDRSSTTQILVPVKSRVSSGRSGINIDIRDQSGETSYAQLVVPVTLHSALETTLFVGLGVITAALVGFGVWRSLRRSAKRKTKE